MNERIKELRKELNLTMEKFGERLGVKKAAISLLESGKNALTDQMFKSICREFNVNPDWLQNGTLPMFQSDDTDDLEAFIRSRQVDGLEAEMLRLYFGLNPELRKELVQHFKENFLSKKSQSTGEAAHKAGISNHEHTKESTVAAAESAYEKALGIVPKTDSTVSNITKGTERKKQNKAG